MPIINTDEWMSGRDASKMTGYTYQWIVTLGRRGEIEMLETSWGLIFKRDSIEQYQERQQGKAAA